MITIGMDKEKWKTIKNFKDVIDDTYQVSNYGNVRFKDTKQDIHKKIANKKYHPYYAVSLKRKNKNPEWVLVHQLVAFKFLKVPKKYKNEKDLVPDHLDNNGLNNYYENLEYKTRGENIKASFERKDINLSGENHRDSFITDKQADMICKFLASGKNYDWIMKKMDFPKDKSDHDYKRLLVRIKHGSSFKHISSKYTFDKVSTKYSSKAHKDIIKKLPKIRKMQSDGYSDAEIFNKLWKGEKVSRNSKMLTLKNIRNNKSYTDV